MSRSYSQKRWHLNHIIKNFSTQGREARAIVMGSKSEASHLGPDSCGDTILAVFDDNRAG